MKRLRLHPLPDQPINGGTPQQRPGVAVEPGLRRDQQRDENNDRAEIEAFRSHLAGRFARRFCHCGAPAIAVIVGQEPMRQVGILLQRGKSDRNLCLLHAGLLDNARVA